jgi:acyl-CoA oxidase
MLMKYTKLEKDGCFSIDGDTRALYSVMLHIRMLMISHSGNTLLRACLIATRYSVVRR